MKTARRAFSSLDRRFACQAEAADPDRYRLLYSLPKDAPVIARGAGVSYTAASFGPGVLSVGMGRFDRILAFDEASGVVDVEAGVTLGKLYDFLSARGLYLPVQPGHPQITVGGCVAFNIHGKNQYREGLFDSCVEELELFHPAKGTLRASRGENAELFELTCGGFGLTGIVVRAKLRARRIPAPAVRVRHVPAASLEETFALVERLKGEHDMLYSWNDLSRPGRRGAGFVTCGDFAPETAAPALPRRRDLDAASAALPLSAYNRATVPLLNAAYRLKHVSLERESLASFFAFTFPVVDKTFYFGLFGRSGFVERQMLVPRPKLAEWLRRAQDILSRRRPLVVLATVKAFKGPSSLLRYAGDGLSVSFDTAGGGDADFHRELDELNAALGVLDNPAKDSRLTGSVMAREYPEYGRFRERLRAFDPNRLFRSEMSERLGL